MPTKTLKSLERGLDLLLLFSRDRPLLSAHEISQALEIPQSTAYRLLATCRKKNVIVRDPQSRKYALDPGLLRLQTAIRAHLDITRISMPHLEDLAALSGETSQLYLRQGAEVICAEAISSPNMIRFMPEKGKGLPLHAPAAGRVVLAFLPEAFLATYIRQNGLRAMTPFTVTDPEALRTILAQIRKQGYAISFQQMYLGARGVAVPLFDHEGKVMGSLGVSGPDPRFSDHHALELVPALRDYVGQLTASMGGAGRRQPTAAGR